MYIYIYIYIFIINYIYIKFEEVDIFLTHPATASGQSHKLWNQLRIVEPWLENWHSKGEWSSNQQMTDDGCTTCEQM